MFAYMHEDATPDVLIVGKALSGGSIGLCRSCRPVRSSVSLSPVTTAVPSVEIRWPAPSPALLCV